MPQGRSGLSTRTALNTVLDAGEVWLNIDVTALEDGSASAPWGDATAASGAGRLGGTRGGNTFAENTVVGGAQDNENVVFCRETKDEMNE